VPAARGPAADIGSPEVAEVEKKGTPVREMAAWGVAVALLAVVLYMSLGPSQVPTTGRILLRSSIITPDSIYIHSFGAGLGFPVISPDGRAVAFSGVTPDGRKRIYVRNLDETETRPIPGTDGGIEPFWSPDGKMLGFFDGAGMRKVDLVGGAPTTIARVPNARGATWNEAGTIAFVPDYQTAMYSVSADGKDEPVRLTTLDSTRHEGSHRWPFFLPDGKHLLYLSRAASESGDAEGDAIFVTSLDGSVNKMLVQSSFNPAYADGYLLFARTGVLLAQRFDPDALELQGDPVVIQEGLLTDVSYNAAVFTVSKNGVLLFQTGKAEAGARPMFADRAGKTVRFIEDRNEQDHVRYSPDGKQIALYLYDTRSRRSNIWIYDLKTSGRRRLTTRSTGDFTPVWSPDGSRIIFRSGGQRSSDLYEQPVAHSGGDRLFADIATVEQPYDFSPDGKTLIVGTSEAGAPGQDLWLVPATGDDRTPKPFQKTKFDENGARISRDGIWVAYSSDEGGDDEVYLKRLSAPESDPWKVSTGGGGFPLWGPTSNELIYVNYQNEVVSVSLRFAGEGGEVAGVKKLFTLPPFWAYLDISPDGKTFVITRNLEIQKFPPLSMVVNWDEALKK